MTILSFEQAMLTKPNRKIIRKDELVLQADQSAIYRVLTEPVVFTYHTSGLGKQATRYDCLSENCPGCLSGMKLQRKYLTIVWYEGNPKVYILSGKYEMKYMRGLGRFELWKSFEFRVLYTGQGYSTEYKISHKPSEPLTEVELGIATKFISEINWYQYFNVNQEYPEVKSCLPDVSLKVSQEALDEPQMAELPESNYFLDDEPWI